MNVLLTLAQLFVFKELQFYVSDVCDNNSVLIEDLNYM